MCDNEVCLCVFMCNNEVNLVIVDGGSAGSHVWRVLLWYWWCKDYHGNRNLYGHQHREQTTHICSRYTLTHTRRQQDELLWLLAAVVRFSIYCKVCVCLGLYPLVGWKIGSEVVYLAEGNAADTGTAIRWAQEIGEPSAFKLLKTHFRSVFNKTWHHCRGAITKQIPVTVIFLFSYPKKIWGLWFALRWSGVHEVITLYILSA